jgi:hypothetical protein
MPGRSTQQNLRNFEAISLRLEPLAVVNELLFGNIKIGLSGHVRSFVKGGFGSQPDLDRMSPIAKTDIRQIGHVG